MSNIAPLLDRNPQNVHVSGHVYDVGTGLVTTIVEAKSKK